MTRLKNRNSSALKDHQKCQICFHIAWSPAVFFRAMNLFFSVSYDENGRKKAKGTGWPFKAIPIAGTTTSHKVLVLFTYVTVLYFWVTND